MDYVEQTGGAKTTADLDRAYVEAPNGDVRKLRPGRFRRAPEITPGSAITIPAKPAETSSTWGETLTKSLQIITGAMSLLIGYLAVTRN